MIQGIRLGNVMIDCGNEKELCDFYHKLLGWTKCEMFGRPAVQSEEGIVFMFMQEENYIPPVWPEEANKQQKQMHFDFQVPDVPVAIKMAETIGAVQAKSQFGGSEFTTMIDPAGHPFCLCAIENTP